MELVGGSAYAIRDPNFITTPGNYATHLGVGVRNTGLSKNFTQLTTIRGGFMSVLGTTYPGHVPIELGGDSRRTDVSATVRFENQGKSIAIADMVEWADSFATTVDGMPIGAYIESLTPVTPDVPDVIIPPKIVVTGTASTDRTISLAWNSALIPSGSSYIVRATNGVTGVSYTREIIASVGNGVTLTGLTAAAAHTITITPKGATDGTASVTTVNVSTAAAPTEPTEPTDPTTPGDTSNPVRTGIVGDSNSNGHKGNLVTGIAEGWAYIAQTNGFIEFAGGWANSGATSLRMAQYTPDLSTAEAIVIMAGTNNLTEENTKGNGGELDPVIWLRDIKAIIAKAKNTNVLILAIPPFNVYAPQAKRANVLMANMAASNGWDFLDPWIPFRTSDGKWTEGAGQKDNIHAAKATYAAVGKSVETFLVNKYRD
jgi:acyl-CoA thioesterase-1